MKYKDTVEECLKRYSSLFRSRFDVDEQLFAVIGNGYEWYDGELVPRGLHKYRKTSRIDIISDMLNFEIKESYEMHYMEEELRFWKMMNDKDELTEEDICAFTKFIVNKIYDDVDKRMNGIKHYKKAYMVYEPTIMIYDHENWTLYPICDCSKLVTFPDGIKPDWRDALYKFVCHCLEHTEYIDKEYAYERQIKYLEESKARLEKLMEKTEQDEKDY